MCAAHREHEQHRVQADERRRPPRALPEARGRAGDQRDGAEAGRTGDGLQRPQPACEAERRGGVAAEREEGPVGRVLERPADEHEGRIGGGFGCYVRVGVQAVQSSHAGKRQVAEDVL